MVRSGIMSDPALFDEYWELFEPLVDKALLIEAEVDLEGGML
jgi:hypothetical protein